MQNSSGFWQTLNFKVALASCAKQILRRDTRFMSLRLPAFAVQADLCILERDLLSDLFENFGGHTYHHCVFLDHFIKWKRHGGAFTTGGIEGELI